MAEIHHPTTSFSEYCAFYAIDRALYLMLVFDLWRDPVESIEVLALWILFERRGLFKNFVNFMFSLPPSMVAYFADEALTCLEVIKEEGFLVAAETRGIWLTSNLLEANISLQFFSQNWASLGRDLGNIISEVFSKAFLDILRDALDAHGAYDGRAEDLVYAAPFAGGNHQAESPREDRTMCMTFSMGCYVDETEVRPLFTALFGVDCIEAFYMHKSPSPDEQPLYARIIFTSTAVVDKILNGADKAKLTVNKKQLWMQKFVTKACPNPA